MNKSYQNNLPSQESISDEDLKLINGYSQKELTADEIFTFSVILCDNEIDRDFERFTTESLKTLAELFVGRTAIKNHSCNSDDQSARTYKTELVTDEKNKNSLGEPYVYVKAYCYMPRLEKNADFIKEIQAGIKKEVSIGCSVKSSVCSICGNDSKSGTCHHKKGRSYKGKLCYFELNEPCDAYEWSFVAVPAQRNAGVTKSFGFIKETDMNDIINTLKHAEGDVALSEKQAREIGEYIVSLTEKARDGEEYRRQLESETVKLFALNMPALSNVSSESICKSLCTEELKQLNVALKEKKQSVEAPQLYREKGKDTDSNTQFRF